MGRKSKLTPEQWAEVGRRLLEGEAGRALAEEFGLSEASLRAHFKKEGEIPKVQQVAQMIVSTQSALESLPVSAQISAQKLATRLRNISENLAASAEYGTATSRRLTALANAEVQKIDDANLLTEESVTAMKGVHALTKLANDSASIGLNLMAANKETVQRMNGAAEEGDDDEDDARTEALARRLEGARDKPAG
jgi:hypothetical protein